MRFVGEETDNMSAKERMAGPAKGPGIIAILAGAVMLSLQPTGLYGSEGEAQAVSGAVAKQSRGSYEWLSEEEILTIPFELFRNNIRMKAQVNGKECYALIDNGSLWDELFFFGSPKVDGLGLNITGETTLGDPNAENPMVADLASGISVEFEGVRFFEQSAVITRYIPGLPNPWEGSDFQVSAAFFKNFVVEINFDESVIRLIPPKKFVPAEGSQEIVMSPGPSDSRTIRADLVMSSGAKITLDLLLDIGGLYPLYLPLGKHDEIQLPEDAVESSLGIGGFGAARGHIGSIRSITLGEFVLEDVKVAFSKASKDSDVYGNTMIGLPLLRRFNITFDYFEERLIFEPSETFDKPSP